MPNTAVSRNFVIVFDGIDGVGKTTQINRASEYLSSEGYKVTIIRNLGSTPIGEKLREVMLSQTPRPPATDLYMSVAIQEALIERIDQLKAEGKIVIMDRSPLSLLAYQSYGSGLPKEKVIPYVNEGMKRINPDITFVLEDDVALAVDRARISSKTKDYFESKSQEFFNQVAQGFKQMSSDFEITYIDVSNGVEPAFKQIKQIILNRLSSN